MKKQWTLPRILVQEFEANEYVAVCWGVACRYNDANIWEREHHNAGSLHTVGGCGTLTNQFLKDTDGDNKPDVMIELSSTGDVDLPCKIYADSEYSTPGTLSGKGAGDTIYWTTEKDYGWGNITVWHHQGVIESTYPGHPNRS